MHPAPERLSQLPGEGLVRSVLTNSVSELGHDLGAW